MSVKCNFDSIAGDCKERKRELKKAKTEFNNELRILVTNSCERFVSQSIQPRENRKEFFGYMVKCLHSEIYEIESETENVD